MRYLPFLRRPALIVPLLPEDAPALHHLHEQAFYHGWGAAAFQNFLNDSRIIGFGSRIAGEKRRFSGFILARSVCGEAEILTFAVTREYRRLGLGRALLEHLLRFLYQERVRALFLEADEQNAPALALYRALGFQETGRRKAYYNNASAAAAETGKTAGTVPGGDNIKRSDAILFEYRLKQPASRSSQNR
ncbi:GNAT family N-acetyltransferase [Candidatus Tokpelaia sp.]|uniref:GNAT family N-acetyltransferase n=1 Tax=Candidatus Tokpelaia sp. TaxID=2233777 RepID=UPI001239F702|nr:GNAT family N-acetyltransferase [Candidatus Tokpelaia sp.]KAA6405145.1 ribosomal-protein-alanine acetyltransferase [Candidatus Tokpelaia sp.]